LLDKLGDIDSFALFWRLRLDRQAGGQGAQKRSLLFLSHHALLLFRLDLAPAPPEMSIIMTGGLKRQECILDELLGHLNSFIFLCLQSLDQPRGDHQIFLREE